MKDATLLRLGRYVGVVGILLGAGGTLTIAVLEPEGLMGQSFIGPMGIFGMGLLAVGWATIGTQPRNGAVWTLIGSGLSGCLYAASAAAVVVVTRLSVPSFGTSDFFESSVSDLPTAAAAFAMIASWAWIPASFGVPTLGFLLFPGGRLPSPRWRWVVGLSGAAVAVLAAVEVWVYRPSGTTPIGVGQSEYPSPYGGIAGAASTVVIVAALASVGSLVVRYRRSDEATRRQIRWIGLGGAYLILTMALGLIIEIMTAGGVQGPTGGLTDYLFISGLVALIASFWVAIAKYRLYDVDVVISKTVTYGALAVLTAALYAASVFAYILVFGDSEQDATGDLGLALPLGATLTVALAFEPLRQRLQRWANRLVYGRRAEPTYVLSQLADKLGDAAIGGDLAGLAELLREGTAAEQAVVWLRVGDSIRAMSASPPDATPAEEVASAAELPNSDTELAVPVLHGGELLGALHVLKSRAHPVTSADRNLLKDVAAAAALLMRNLRLNAELSDRAGQLTASRRRLIEAQDAVRHRLERDLHDGAQQQVVALKVKLGIAKTIAEREGLSAITDHLDSLADETDQAIEEMRRIARGIYPPLLQVEGLETALTAAGRTFRRGVDIEIADLGRFDRAIEETVYFGALNAIASAVEAGASRVHASLARSDGVLRLRVTSNAATQPDATALVDRIDAVGGSFRAGPRELVAEIPVDRDSVDAGAQR